MRSLEKLFLGRLRDHIDSFATNSVLDLSVSLPCLTDIACVSIPLDLLSIRNQVQLRCLTLSLQCVQDACAFLKALPLLDYAEFSIIRFNFTGSFTNMATQVACWRISLPAL